MDRLKARIWRFLPEEKKFLHKIYLKFIDDHANIWREAENLDLARLRYILFVIVKLFYEEHKHLTDISQIDQQEFNRAVRELIADPDALLQKTQKAQIKAIDRLGVERWFNAFRKDIEKLNQIIIGYERDRAAREFMTPIHMAMSGSREYTLKREMTMRHLKQKLLDGFKPKFRSILMKLSLLLLGVPYRGEYEGQENLTFRQLVTEWQEIIVMIKKNLNGDKRLIALGIVMRSELSYRLLEREYSENRDKYSSAMDLYKIYFPEIIPDYLVQFCSDAGKTYGATVPQIVPVNHEEYFIILLAEALTGQKILPDQRSLPIDIRQNRFWYFYHGFPIKKIAMILDEGIKSNRRLAAEGKSEVSDSAFPMFISMVIPYGGGYGYNKNNKYLNTSTSKVWGAGESSDGKVTAIINPDYVSSRSFHARDLEWRFYQCYNDEYESLFDLIPPEHILGIICTDREKEKVTEILVKKKSKMKVYNIHGDQLYPEQKSHIDVTEEYKRKFLIPLRRLCSSEYF